MEKSATDFILKNVHVVNPKSNEIFYGSLHVVDGIIADIAPGTVETDQSALPVFDGEGLHAIPGLIDLSVGFGGGAHRESAARVGFAAARSGVTHIVAEPDCEPIVDTPAVADYLRRKAAGDCIVKSDVTGALTKNLKGAEPTEIGLIKDAGAVFFTDGDRPIENSEMLYRIMRYAAGEDALIALHCEDKSLSEGGCVAAGKIATLYGLPGIPETAEIIALERDCRLAEAANCKLHIRQISSGASPAIIERFKDTGVNLTAGVSAHHLLLNELDIIPYKTFLKTRPPLRGEEDRKALIRAVKNGVIDVVTSAHRPRTADSKRLPFIEADYGCAGIETLFSAVLSLYHSGDLSLCEALRPVTCNPAARLGLASGRLEKGAPADFFLADLNRSYRVMREEFVGFASNTPFENRLFEGCVTKVFLGGKVIFDLNSLSKN